MHDRIHHSGCNVPHGDGVMLGKLTKTLWETSTIGIGYQIEIEKKNPIQTVMKPVQIATDLVTPLGLMKKILK
jgi:hypothetical protein